MRAAQEGIKLGKVQVDIEADADFGCVFGLPSTPYSEFRYSVLIESDAPGAQVRALIEEADRRSPVLHAFCEAKRVVRTVHTSRPEAVAESEG
jgi:hypothetical protein